MDQISWGRPGESMAVDTEAFSELMHRVRRGDADALQAVMDGYGQAIRREVRFTLLDTRLRRFVGDSDVYQSVVIRFFAGMREGSFRIESPVDLVRLLKGITRTRIAELVRFWHAQRRDLSRTTNDDALLFSNASDKGQSPDEVLVRAEMSAAIQRRLTPRDLEILRLRDDGLSWTGISAQLNGVSGEAVRKQHMRAMSRIAAEIKESDVGEFEL